MIKDIKEYEGLYQITNDGKVFSCKRNKYLKPKVDKYGYECVRLSKNGIVKYFTIHRLVAKTYIPLVEGMNVVNHIDSNKLNNNVNNLEWTTVSGNTKHCYNNNNKFREQVLNNSKIGSEKRKKKIVIKGIKFNSQKEASDYYKVNIKTIYSWLKGGDANDCYRY